MRLRVLVNEYNMRRALNFDSTGSLIQLKSGVHIPTYVLLTELSVQIQLIHRESQLISTAKDLHNEMLNEFCSASPPSAGGSRGAKVGRNRAKATPDAGSERAPGGEGGLRV